jgi:hypothetical protein
MRFSRKRHSAGTFPPKPQGWSFVAKETVRPIDVKTGGLLPPISLSARNAREQAVVIVVVGAVADGLGS